MEPFFFILIPLFLVGTILAFVTYSNVRRLESILKSFPLNQLTFRVYQLEQKIAELQKKVASGEVHATAPLPSVAPAEPAAAEQVAPRHVPEVATPPVAPALPTPPLVALHIPQASYAGPVLGKVSKEPSSADLEALIGGRWFNRIGIIALLFAVSYFLKLAFDNNWIGPAGRVTIGILLGLAMLPWSDWLLSREYTYFSEGIAGLGEATLFVSVWAGCQYYTLFSRQWGFVALVLVTVIMAYLALRRNSERIAFLSLLGGLLTPALMSSGKNEQVVLFSYLLLLGAAAVMVSWRKNWQSLLPLAFGATHLYFWQWYDLFYIRSGYLGSTLIFVTLIFVLFAIVPAARALLRQPLRAFDVLLVVANAGAYIAILYTLLWQYDRWPLTLLFLALAIGHEAIALLLPDPNAPEAATPRFLYTGLAAACLTLAIPAKLEHNAVALALIVEGAVLVWTGFRSMGSLLRPFGYFLLFLAAVHLITQPPLAGTFLFNERFGTYLALIAALAVCLWSALRSYASAPHAHPLQLPGTPSESQPETPFGSAQDANRSGGSKSSDAPVEAAFLTATINFFALLALSLEFWDYFGSGPRTVNHSLAQHLSISILWTAYAGLLLLLGMQRQSALLRWEALFLLGVVVIKVFLYDLSFLDRAYRIFSFFILGSALLIVSFLYQRKLARARSSP
jgi:uncharacterized membrane protein